MQINSDQKRLKQVLFNLLGNAVKFTFQGAISISVDFDEDNNHLLVDVEDTEHLHSMPWIFATKYNRKNLDLIN